MSAEQKVAKERKKAWEAEAKALTLKRFQNEIGQQHIHFDCANTDATEHWSRIKPLSATKKTSNATEQSWSIEPLDPQRKSRT